MSNSTPLLPDKQSKKRKTFSEYGPSIVHFFKFQTAMIRLFLLLSILALMQAAIFRYSHGLQYYEEYMNYAPLLTFGNIGFQKNVCLKVLIEKDSATYNPFKIVCENKSEISKVLDSGLILSSAYPGGHDRFIPDCTLSNKAEHDGNHPWMRSF